MKMTDNGNSIHSLPKKQLQDLCRKHGLSPYKTKSSLVTSLAPYVKGAEEVLFKDTKDTGNSTCNLPTKELHDLCRKHDPPPHTTKTNLVSSLIPCVKGADDFLLKDMKIEDIENSICKLPKKELQDLCRKHGLSPYKTKPNLVNSLITYFKGAERFSLEMKTKDSENSICSLPKKKLQDLCKQYGLSPYKTKPNLVNSLMTYLKKADIETSKGNVDNIQDSFGLRSTIGEMPTSKFTAQCDENGFEQRVDSQQISFDKNTFDIKSTDMPSFEFFVSSEDGINLYVDLNSCPSDWYKQLEKTGHVCQHFPNKQFQNFCQEIQYLRNERGMTSSFLLETDSNSGFNNGHAQTVSRPCLCVATENTDDASLGFSATTKSFDGSIDYFTCSEGKKGSPASSGTICGVQNMKITDVNTFTGQEEIQCVGLNTSKASDKAAAINKTVNVVADTPENTTNENQNTRLSDASCHNSESQRDSTPEKLLLLAHLSSETDFTEIRTSEAAKDCLRNLVDAAESVRSQFPDSYEDSYSIFLDDMPSSADGGARDSHVKGTEASKELLKKQKEPLPHGEKKRKRHDNRSVNVFNYNGGRILRSAKWLQRLRRRSMQLISK